MGETNNDNTEIELENEYQPTEDIMSLIKEQTSGITIKNDDIKNLTKILKEWNDCYLSKEEPKKELEEIKIDNFTLSYEEFKNLLDNGLLSNQYYINSSKDILELRENSLSSIKNPDILEAYLDRMMPSMSKDGIFNMMTYNLAKHSSVSNEIELHYAINNTNSDKIGFKNLNDNIIEKSKTDKKLHFVLTDTNKTKKITNSGHVTPYIIMNGEIFEFDSVSTRGVGEGYATKYLQQTDNTSCKTIAIREVDNFLKILENFDSIEEFSSYLKQFFSKNKIEYYIDLPTYSLREGPKLEGDLDEMKKNRRLAILPFPVIKNSQSLSSLENTLIFIQNLEKKHKGIFGSEKEEFIKKYKHILEMKDSLDKLIKRFKIRKKISKNKITNINAYTLKERLRQAKVLAILLENGLTKSLEDIREYKNTEKGKAALATVDKNWIREINNKTEDNIKNRKNRISENNELNIGKEKIENKNLNEKQKVDTKNYNDDIELNLTKTEKLEQQYKEKNKTYEKDIIYEIEKKIPLKKLLKKEFFTASKIVEQQILNQNELSQQNIRNELDNKKENEIKEQGV